MLDLVLISELHFYFYFYFDCILFDEIKVTFEEELVIYICVFSRTFNRVLAHITRDLNIFIFTNNIRSTLSLYTFSFSLDVVIFLKSAEFFLNSSVLFSCLGDHSNSVAIK